MRKFCWQRWTLIVLLMTRLVMGELGHAMPMTGMDAVDHAAAMTMNDAANCAEHDSGKQMPTAHHGGDSMHDSGNHHSSGESECCKSGDCECPCLQAPCTALDALILTPIATSLRVPQGTDDLASQRPSGLFRPPA